MITSKQIKIIKRKVRSDSDAVGPDEKQIGAHEKPKRDAMTVVSGWITELRRRKAEEATQGFDRLFGAATMKG